MSKVINAQPSQPPSQPQKNHVLSSSQSSSSQFQQYKPFKIQKQHANYQQQQSTNLVSQATQTQTPQQQMASAIPQNTSAQKTIYKAKMAAAYGEPRAAKRQAAGKGREMRGKESIGLNTESLPINQQTQKQTNKNSASDRSGQSGEDQESSLMNLSNTPINVGTNDQEVQIIKKYGASTSSKYSSNRCRSAVRSSSSFDSTRVMINVLYKGNQLRQRSTLKHRRHDQQSAKSSVFHSTEKVSSITFDSFSQYNNGQSIVGANYANQEIGHYSRQEIFENYSDSLEILDSQQIDRFTNKTSTQSQKSNNRRLSAEGSQRDSQIPEEDLEALSKSHGYTGVLDEQQFITEASRAMLDYNYEQATDTIFHQKLMQASATLNSAAFGSHHPASNGQVPQIYLNTARKQIQMQMDTLKAFCQDKRKIRELMTHCLYCIYRQQDMSKYFDEMLTISKLMRDYYLDSLSLGGAQASNAGHQQQSKQFSVGLSMTAQLQSQLQQQVQPSFLKDMITEIVGEIMKSICEQILAKMKYLGIIVKEPLFRRASVDDYSLCFDYFSRKNANSQNLIQGSSFGLSLGNYGVFTNNVDLRNLNQQGNNYDHDDSSLSGFSQCQSQRSQFSSSKQEEHTIQEALRKKKELFGGICTGASPAYTSGGLNTQLHLAFKQQQEMYLDNGQGYEFIRQEGKRSTWRDIKNSRTRLQHFIYRQQEYKQTFDMIMRSYQQLKNSLEHLEEFWLFLYETIYDKYQHGKLQFDKIWKNLFLEKILDNHYVKNFLNDVSDQYDSLQNYNQQMQQQTSWTGARGAGSDNHRYILDEIYENLIKLENDLNEDYIMDDLSKLINIDELPNQSDGSSGTLKDDQYVHDQNRLMTNLNLNSKAINSKLPVSHYTDDPYDHPDYQNQNGAVMQQLNLVIANQYELIREKFRLKYNGQTLSQIVHQCNQQGLSNAQTLQLVQESKIKRTCNTARDSIASQTNFSSSFNGSQSQRCHQTSGTLGASAGTSAPPLTKSQKKRKRKKMQEQMRKWKDEVGATEGQQAQDNDAKKVPKIELIQCDQDVAEKERDGQELADDAKQSKKMADTSKLFRKLIIKNAAIKKQQKGTGKNKDKKGTKDDTSNVNTARSHLAEDSSKRVATQESEQEPTTAAGDEGKLSKRQKLNQKKKRQRIEKKKRIQQEKEDADYGDAQLMGHNDQTLLEMYKFDPNEFMDDPQLKLLIDKYDPAMNQQDVDYLMQHEDREAVINTLYTKLMEREQMNMQILRESGTLMDQYQDMIDDGDIYYEDDIDGNYTTSYAENVNGKQSTADQSSAHQYYGQSNRYYYHTHDKSVNYDRNSLALANSQHLQVQNWQQKISTNVEILDQVEYDAVQEQKLVGHCSQRSQSNISHEEEIYDSDFESELKHFQKKLQPRSRECSIERIYLNQQGRYAGSSGRHSRKLVPNISKEWIDELKKEIQQYNQKLNKSLDQRMRQLKLHQESVMKQGGEKSSNSDRFRSPTDKNNPYADVVSDAAKVSETKQRLSLPNNVAQRVQYHQDNCYISQGAGSVRPYEQTDSFKRLPTNLGALDVYPQKSGGIAYPFHGCTTNSTEGLSFNSPRATEQVCGYDEVEEIEKSQQISRQGRLIDEQYSAAAGLFMPANDDQENFKVCNTQISSIDQAEQQSEKQNNTKQSAKQSTKGNTEKKKANQKQRSKAANEGKRGKKKGGLGGGGRLDHQQKGSSGIQPLSA